ncbi:MAG: UTP--glucose-1-phosphate uridylyltransferase, partial [bacterium]
MNALSNHPDEQKLIERVYEAGQGHVFRFWDELKDDSRRRLLNQLKEVDFDLLAELDRKFIQTQEGDRIQGKLEPADFIALPKSQQEKEAATQARLTGERALQQGRVAAFLVAGGQGTRLGFHGPKGLFPISPIKEKSLFQLHAEKILAMSKKYDVVIPWYIMTSETNHQQSIDFFEAHEYFGLNAQDVMFFRQEMVPALDPKGRLILDAKDHIF